MDARQHAMLRLAGERYRFEGARNETMRREFGVSPTRFWQVVNCLLSDPAAEFAEPQLVRRLRRVRDERLRSQHRRVA